MRWIWLSLALAGCPKAGALGPPPEVVPTTDLADEDAVAAWLMGYDMVAWVSTDAMMALAEQDLARRAALGNEWFAWEEDGMWHAVYGRYDGTADTYTTAGHFRCDLDAGGIHPVLLPDPPGPEITLPRARAIHTAFEALPSEMFTAQKRLNTYVRAAPGGGLEVWVLPAWQPDGTLVIGNAATVTTDAEGRRVASVDAWLPGILQVRPSKEEVLMLPLQPGERPNAYVLFWLRYFVDDFKLIAADNGAMRWTYVEGGGQRVLVQVASPPGRQRR